MIDGRRLGACLAVLTLALGGCRERAADTSPATSTVDACGAAATPIHRIQGVGARSAMLGQRATVEAVVVGVFDASLGGYFVQEEAIDRDGDPMTSEGLFVQADPSSVKVGDLVRISGIVAELGEDEATVTALIELSSFRACGTADLPVAASIEQAPLVAGDWEAYEGMRLSLDTALTLIDAYGLRSRGEWVVSLAGRQYQPTELYPPGEQARRVAADNARHRLVLDDGAIGPTAERPRPLDPPISRRHPYRVGSTLSGVEGVLDHREGSYRVHLYAPPNVQQAARPTEPPTVGGTVRVASFNLQNYFNGDGRGGGFPTARGASSRSELERQRAKLIAVLSALSADVYALMEVENDDFGRDSAIAELTRALNQALGRRDAYAYVRLEQDRIGTDEIRVGLLYHTRTLRLVGSPATLEGAPFDRHHRPPLAASFEQLDGGGRFTVVANHFKSKRCDEADLANLDRRDGQGCWNHARLEAARALADWLATAPTGLDDPDVLIVGDLNAYGEEDPIRLLAERGYVRLAQVRDEPPYTYVHRGQSGSLDHALATASLRTQARGVAIWHINADEAPWFDYNQEERSARFDARVYAADPFRSSDHDPLLIGFELVP